MDKSIEPARHRILLVDDHPQAMKLLTMLAKKAGYQYETAADGAEALDKVTSAKPGYFSAIVSDRMMPKMDGMALLKTIKQNSDYQHIPFILQTALSDADSVQEGIKAGAFYYLTKPLNLDVVEKVIASAIIDFEAHTALMGELETVKDSFALIEEATFQFKTVSEAKKLAAAISILAEKPAKAVLGLYELMVNAVEHGNLGITYDEKTRLIQTHTLIEEIKRRQRLPENADKRVRIRLKIDTECLQVEITDMGQGFDFEPYLTFSPERMMDNHGRGIMIANGIGFRHLEYRNQGRTVLCELNRNGLESDA